jgi:hypothetical protein
MTLLVVSPTLGRSPYMTEMVASVARWAPDARHVLVAPGSAVAELGRRFGNAGVSVVAEAGRGGMYAAIDQALAGSSTWDWFTYLNDDDLLAPGFVELRRRHLELGDPMAIGFGEVRMIDALGLDLGLMPVARHPRWFAPLAAAGIPPFTQQGTLVSRQLWLELGGFGDRFRLLGDFAFWVKAIRAGSRFVRYRDEVAAWRIHGAQLSMSRTAALDELSMIAGTIDGTSRFGRSLARVTFHVENAARYARRFQRTGTLRTEALLRRAVEQSQGS